MTSKQTIYSLIVFILIIGIVVFTGVVNSRRSPVVMPITENTSTSTMIAAVQYMCDKGKTISAVYYEGPEQSNVQRGEMPTPNGSVDVALDGGATTTLKQTLSGSGVRYANADESFVFWNKGDEALIMRNNAMDLNYTNCKATLNDH